VTSCSVGDMQEEPSRSEFFGLLGSAV